MPGVSDVCLLEAAFSLEMTLDGDAAVKRRERGKDSSSSAEAAFGSRINNFIPMADAVPDSILAWLGST